MAFWAFISFHFLLVWAATWAPLPHKLPKTVRFLIKFKEILSAPRPAAFCNFWPFKPSFPFILAFWVFISFHFGVFRLHFLFDLFGLHFLLFWFLKPSFPFILAFWAFISFHFDVFGLHFLSFWLFRASFPFILAFCAFISFHFGLLGFHFLSFWPFGFYLGLTRGALPTSCPKVAFPCLISSKFNSPGAESFSDFGRLSIHFDLLGLHFLSF